MCDCIGAGATDDASAGSGPSATGRGISDAPRATNGDRTPAAHGAPDSRRTVGFGKEVYAFAVGDITVVTLDDGYATLPAQLYAANAPQGQIEQLLGRAGLNTSVVQNRSQPVVFDTGTEVILLDAGFGDVVVPGAPGPTGGKLQSNLRAAGYEPAQISQVVISHASADHIGGLLDDTGAAAFPNARHVFFRSEWDTWNIPLDTPALDEFNRSFFLDTTRRVFPVIADRLHLIDEDTELAPGITALAQPGHTPGHIGLAVRSKGDQLLHVGDSFAHHILTMKHPEWHFGADVEPELAVDTRQRLLAEASQQQLLTMAYHLPFPSTGIVQPDDDAYTWQTVRP